MSSPALPEPLLQPLAVNKRFRRGDEGVEDEGSITSPLSGAVGPVSPKETPDQKDDSIGSPPPKVSLPVLKRRCFLPFS